MSMYDADCSTFAFKLHQVILCVTELRTNIAGSCLGCILSWTRLLNYSEG